MKIVTKQRKPAKLTVPEQEERARHLQETIGSTINPPRYYNAESSRHTAITRKLAMFIGATNVTLLDSEEFLVLLPEMDRKYHVPHLKGVS